ncbi:DUF2177 family protein [Methylopila turkensis]|uniref:Membrane protein n=1 Tax=Methylopila turkensis TaxID=1437816 RepID=A0A9W6JM99_9HYPH|nr:DUF2177 family protein [Methylopila turkensis]GLK78425.1 membrane protein [Methylopila turkensis]
MKTWIVAYVATAVVFFALDLLWLGVIARDFYRDQLGPLMLERPNLAAAGAFYAMYVVGVVIFAVLPSLGGTWAGAFLWGALFGAFCYATYDLTNFATLKGWPVAMTFVDIAWGTFLTGVSATVGVLVTRSVVGAP